MKNIILFCEALRNRAGIERMTVELAALLAEDYTVTIVTIDPFDPAECPYPIDPRVKVESLDSRFNKRLLSIKGLNIGNIRRLRRVLKRLRPAAVISVATPLVRIAVPASIGLKIKNIGWEHFNINAGSRIGTLYKALAPWIADTTVVLTEADAADYRRYRAPRVRVIANFTTIGRNEPSRLTEKVALAVGRHTAQKGFDLLLKAWAVTDAPGWTLRIVGSGEDRDANERLASDLGIADRVDFRDSTPEIAREFQGASCFVLSSRYEGLVLVLIEARMMGLPCVSFDCPNSPSEIINDGVDGLLVAPEDTTALARTLTAALADTDRLARMGRLARTDALSRFSPEAVKQLWVNVIEK